MHIIHSDKVGDQWTAWCILVKRREHYFPRNVHGMIVDVFDM